MYLILSIAGPVLVLAGLAGALGFGIPGPYWFVAELVGVGLVMLGQHRERQLQQEGDPSAVANAAFTQKRHRFWIFVMIASIAYAASSFWLPVMTPKIRATLCYSIMAVTCLLCIGIFLYSSRKKP
jgi:hypothetical protein